MLMLNLKTAKYSERTPLSALSAYQLNLITHSGFVFLKKVGNDQKTSYVITPIIIKMKSDTTLTLDSLDFINLIAAQIKLK